MVKLNLESNEPKPVAKKKNRALKIGLGVGALVLVPVIGMTFAASITINSDSPIQFGQGLQQATACDSDVTITPISSFSNTTGSGSFNLSTVEISNIDQNACNGAKFKLSAYGNSSSTRVTLSSGGTNSPSCYATLTVSGGALTGVTSESSNTCVATLSSAKLLFTLPANVAATDIYKFTIESL